MLYTVMKHIRNFFHVRGAGKSGLWKVEDGTIVLPFIKNGQYFQIEGSVFNDGVFRYPSSGMVDEEFVGYISPLAVPMDFLNLVEEISEWCEKNDTAANTPYQSESFGGYSYTRATDSNGNAVGWQDVYKKRLNAWRKI